MHAIGPGRANGVVAWPDALADDTAAGTGAGCTALEGKVAVPTLEELIGPSGTPDGVAAPEVIALGGTMLGARTAGGIALVGPTPAGNTFDGMEVKPTIGGGSVAPGSSLLEYSGSVDGAIAALKGSTGGGGVGAAVIANVVHSGASARSCAIQRAASLSCASSIARSSSSRPPRPSRSRKSSRTLS